MLRHAQKVAFDGEWAVMLNCGHFTPAKNEQEARRMATVETPVRCYQCVDNFGPRVPIMEDVEAETADLFEGEG